MGKDFRYNEIIIIHDVKSPKIACGVPKMNQSKKPMVRPVNSSTTALPIKLGGVLIRNSNAPAVAALAISRRTISSTSSLLLLSADR